MTEVFTHCRSMRPETRNRALPLLVLVLFVAAGCAGGAGVHHRAKARASKAGEKTPRKTAVWKAIPKLGYAVQAGAFAKVENAAGLTESLRKSGLNATYFVAGEGLYKVQFGNFLSREEARSRAELLQSAGVIDSYYIVSPGDYAAAGKERYGPDYLRDELVETARRYIGTPYLWGGASPETGFDCSGFAMAVYQLNGLDLPRTSREQFDAGIPKEQDRLVKGDLVFFSVRRGDPVSHVGVYAGEGWFIHAPGRGRKIRMDALSEGYYREHFAGGRSYLDEMRLSASH
jgi:cell wall-associated NlpC family hydrolase